MCEPKYEFLKRIIKEKIRAGIWKEGDKIPVQRELEAMFGVSRITVKKATSDLLNENYLEHLPGRKNLFIRKRDVHAGSGTIAVAIDNVTDQFGATLLRGIEDYLWKKGYHTIFCNADRDFDKVEKYFHSFDYKKVDGIIFSPVIDNGYKEKNTKIIQLLIQKGIPHVLADRYVPGIQSNYIVSGDFESCRLMTHSLIKAGHEQILVGLGLECSSMIQRVEGIKQAFRENSLELDEKKLIKVNDNLLHPDNDLNELENMKKQIIQAGTFSAFFAQNDRILNAGIDSMLALEINVDSIQLVLHDEISKPKMPYTDRIPRVIPPVYKMGWTAARVLLDDIANRDGTVCQITLKSEIIYENLRHGGLNK